MTEGGETTAYSGFRVGAMPSDDPAVVAMVQDLKARQEALVVEIADTIEAEIPYYRTGNVDRTDLLWTASSYLGATFGALDRTFSGPRSAQGVLPPDGDAMTAVEVFDSSDAADTGLRWAKIGVPLVAVLSSNRVASRCTWKAVVSSAKRHNAPAQLLVAVASNMFGMQDLAVEAVTESYRSESTAILLSQEAERSALVEALIDGRALPTMTLWEIADLLRLPHEGHFTVVVAELQHPARGVLGDVERHLRTAGFASVWRLLPDLQVGIVSLPDGRHDIRGLLRVLRANSPARQGLSPVFDDLAAAAEANRLARSALLGAVDGAEHVVMFDDAPLKLISVAAPEVNRRIARSVLAGLDALPPEQRGVLLETLSGWFECDGSTSRTADKLYLHRNTVRQRLNRLEHLTNRSLTNPRHITELCVALESEQRLQP